MSQFSKYDSEFCGNIPIHIINTIQEYGVLLVLDKQTLTIEQVSENAAGLFQVPFRDLLGKTIKELIDPRAFALLEKQVQDNNSIKISTTWKLGGRDHFTILHVREDMVLAEIEIAQAPAEGGATFTALYQHIRNSIDLIEQAKDVHELCRIAAEQLKKITWFDKVMIYAFDKDWNGNVLAEAMEPDMESYIGFTFPASDIPKPARDLYLRNPYRFIPDREFKPIKLYPVINPISRSFLDMSECNLRGVAAVHVEYLKNMHVMSSMSVRLIKDNALWGLIACHHKTARVIDGEMRAVMELFSSVISARINALYHQSFSDLSSRLNGIYMQLIESIYQTDNLVASLLNAEPHVMKLLDATGVIITYNNRSHKAGEVPDAAQLEDLLLWLHIKDLKKVFYTDSLPSIYDITKQYREIASGMLVIPMRPEQDEYIILFRKEFVRTTNWGGNPEERMFFDENPQIYHPRHSFKLWQEDVKGFSKPWMQEEILAAENLRSFIFEFLTREHSKE